MITQRIALETVTTEEVTTCDDCGVCCHKQGALPASWYLARNVAAKEEIRQLPLALKEQLYVLLRKHMRAGRPDDAPCIWYDEKHKKCQNYEYRPMPCRTILAPGDKTCLQLREARL